VGRRMSCRIWMGLGILDLTSGILAKAGFFSALIGLSDLI